MAWQRVPPVPVLANHGNRVVLVQSKFRHAGLMS
jgi:hypothetical protein